MDNNSDYRSILNNNRQSNLEQDSEDILHQISQITPSQDKSFDSPVIFTRNHTIFNDYNIDIHQLVKDSNISLFNSQDDKTIKNIKPENILDESNTILINTKQLTLNQKLKYLCSLIQTSNINIKKYDDLKEFNKYLEDKKILLDIFEPINILFDVINELIIVIQKELRNNDILMKELKRLRYNRNDNEKQIYKLKMIIKTKDKELDELRILKKDDYYKYNENEINILKNENKELYKKINTYKFQIKKYEMQNNENKNKLNSYNIDNNIEKIRNGKRTPIKTSLIKCKTNNILPTKNSINNITKNKTINDLNIRKSLKKINLNIIENKTININKNRNYSESKALNLKNFNKKINSTNDNNNNNNSDINNSYNNYNNGRSIIANLMFLLKEINEMLNIYNSSLSKIKINNQYNITNTSINTINNINSANNSNKKETKDEKNETCDVFEENNNMKVISNDFVNKINNIIIDIKDYIKGQNKDKDKLSKNISKKLIHVNTSKWKFRKKEKIEILSPKNIHGKNNDKNNTEENDSLLSLNIEKNIPNKLNLKLIDQYNSITNDEDYDNKQINSNAT